MTRLLPLLLAVALLTGCRESLTGPDPLPDPAAPPSDQMYVKGPDDVPVGQAASFRVGALVDAASYRWAVHGEGGVSNDAATGREFTLRAVAPGWVLVYFTAFGEDDRMVGYAEKPVLLH
jgi:hypothetical protein